MRDPVLFEALEEPGRAELQGVGRLGSEDVAVEVVEKAGVLPGERHLAVAWLLLKVRVVTVTVVVGESGGEGGVSDWKDEYKRPPRATYGRGSTNLVEHHCAPLRLLQLTLSFVSLRLTSTS